MSDHSPVSTTVASPQCWIVPKDDPLAKAMLFDVVGKFANLGLAHEREQLGRRMNR
jgi:hypothetical protein